MKHYGTYLYWTGIFSVWIFASLYVAAMLIAPSDGLQVTGMLGLDRGSDLTVLYGWSYTAGLVATSVCAIASRRFTHFQFPTMIFAGSVLGLTILPGSYSFLHDFRPGLYENYIGELLTIASLILVSVATALVSNRTKVAQEIPTANTLQID